MAKLAIKGHATRGEEVIKILEKLGGDNNSHNFLGGTEYNYYCIGNYNTISCIPKEKIDNSFVTFTIEEFIEKYPYKVGDKVNSKYLKNYEIEKMAWEDTNNKVIYKLQRMGWYNTDELQPYKEETMEKEISAAIVNRFICLEGYDFYDDKGNVIDTKEITMKKKQPKYPKTYEDCCKVLDWNPRVYDRTGYKFELLCKLQVLLICRDAYWIIAGEQMGLDKPWEPDWANEKQIVYGLYNELKYSIINPSQFVFPTEEMRDAFLENFNYLIEQCKELL